MNPTLISPLALDTSGASIDNRVINEPHTLGAFRFRALVPKKGAFFANTLTLTDAITLRPLTLGIDYRFLVPYSTLSMLYAKDIVGAAIIINPEVSASVLATYQALGSDYVHNIPALVDLLSTDNLSAVSDSFIDIQNRPMNFLPSPHIHDLGDGVGFEYLIFAIEMLGRIISNADNAVIASMFDRIELELQEITRKAIHRQDTELTTLLENFRKDFTKEKLGLGKTPNYPMASEGEGSWAAQESFNLGGDINNRLVTLRSLVAFREELMNRVVSTEKTGLGKNHGQYMLPTMAGLESMANGARYLIDSLDASLLSNVVFDRQVYPDLSDPTHRWAMVKITNNKNDRGGVLQSVNMTTGQMFTGILGRLNGQPNVVWRRQMVEADIKDVLDKLTAHIRHNNNPHGLKAAHVGLDQLENLPIADRMTILGRQAKREYVSYDGLLTFFAAFVTGDWTIDDSEGTTPEQKAKARNAYTTLFASSGACGASSDCGGGCDGLVLENAPRQTLSPVPVRGQPAGWYCEGTTKIAKITDGRGGYYLENVENSSDCGYITEVANYQIRDQDGNLLGLGFTAGSRIDPAATVGLQDANGVTVCFIYPVSAVGRQVTIRNSNGDVFGYAINPV